MWPQLHFELLGLYKSPILNQVAVQIYNNNPPGSVGPTLAGFGDLLGERPIPKDPQKK